jgi:hypothetical protein
MHNRRTVLGLIGVFTLNANAQNAIGSNHPRYLEAVKFASNWRDLIDEGKHEEAYSYLSPTFQKNLTTESWKNAVGGTRIELGARLSRSLRRVVWYDNPVNAPLPGLYAAVEFDSVFENARTHFQFIILHSQNGAPFKVMRNESTITLNTSSTETK